MTEQNVNLKKKLPVFMGFIIMGFVDLVGVITAYVKDDFQLSNDLAQIIPLLVFVWFFLLSVPVGIIQDKIGRKNMLLIGMAITGLGMIVPFLNYSFSVMLSAVVFLGIGNTIVQVSANPLLHDISPHGKFPSYMSLSQFIKAGWALLGPIITSAVALTWGNWKLVFVVYFLTSLIAILWLYFTRIEESKALKKSATFSSCFSLMKNKYVVIMVLAIFVLVGTDVGLNTNIPNYLSSVFGLPLNQASLGISIYFTALMAGRFFGAILLNWLPSRKFLLWSTIVTLVSLMGMIFAPSVMIARISIFLVGLGAANTFPLIFAIMVERMPERVNEISGLMIMALSGGAILPPLMGLVSTAWGAVMSLLVLVIGFMYILGTGIYVLVNK